MLSTCCSTRCFMNFFLKKCFLASTATLFSSLCSIVYHNFISQDVSSLFLMFLTFFTCYSTRCLLNLLKKKCFFASTAISCFSTFLKYNRLWHPSKLHLLYVSSLFSIVYDILHNFIFMMFIELLDCLCKMCSKRASNCPGPNSYSINMRSSMLDKVPTTRHICVLEKNYFVLGLTQPGLEHFLLASTVLCW